MIPTKRTYSSLFLVSLATLMYEILLTRIFSVTMWYHFAFVAISVAMFGASVGAIAVYVFPRRFPVDRTHQLLALSAMLFAAASVVSFAVHVRLPFLAEGSWMGVASIGATYLVVSVPFFFSGIFVCLALTRFPSQVSKLYAADLVGAAIGCILLRYTLDFTDAAATVFLVAFLASLAAVCSADGPLTQKLRRTARLYSVLFLILAGLQTAAAWKGRPLLRLQWSKGVREGAPLYEKWNSFSRIRVYGDAETPAQPFGWGLSATLPSDQMIRQLSLDIDSDALTVLTHFDGNTEPLGFLKYDVTNLAHYLRQQADVLVVGAGAGRDILSALVFGQRSVTGVELNGNILEAAHSRFGDFTGHLDRRPGVTLIEDEARSYVARTNTRFDLIQISMIDTWAATAAGAMVLSENSLYTLEAWKTFLERLKPGGILTVSRWNFPDPPGEVYRMVSLASAALRQRGVGNPRDHMMIARRMGPRMSEGLLYGVATLLVSPDPFNEADLRMLESVSQKLGFEIVLSPRHALDTTFAGLSSGEDPEIYSQRYRLNLLPPTDDKPYFFHLLRLNDALGFGFWNQPGVGYYLNAVFILVPLLITVAVLTVLCILLPLWLKRDSGSFRQAGPLLVFFAAIGVGFMLVEISQLQRLMVFLGHPSYALSVVLFALLLSSGLGSLSSARISPILARGPSLWPLLLLLVVLPVFGATTPHILSTYQGSVTPLRVVIATVILFPAGFLMGTAFPLGMRVATIRFPTLTPWFWGVNGAASVLSSVLAVVIALTFGISAAFWTGFSSYCAAALAIAVASRSGPKPTMAIP